MGFFDGLMGDAVKGIGKYAVKKGMQKGMEKATEHAVDAAVGYAVGSAINSMQNRKQSPLQAPPPPPVPVMNQKAMRVMVAVNGQTYGPYERVTLEEMVANGALTSETYVFMEGMQNWAPASAVACVAELLANRAPAPAAPPVPWANVPEAPAAPQHARAQVEDNGFSPKLNALITSAVADGEISDLERQVLVRNAQSEGVSMDEFVMVLEARLYERQQELREMHAEKERKDKAAQAQIQAAAAASRPAPAQPARATKCPHCGAPIKPMSTTCPECGNDYGDIASNDSSAWVRLQEKIAQADAANAKKSFWSAGIDVDEIIMQFPVPNTKVEMFDFFSYCAPMARSESVYSDSFKDKSVQILSKAHILFKDDAAMLEKFDTIAADNKIKLKNKR